jgi:hypothetical protein
MTKETLEEAAENYANKKGHIPTTELEDAIFKQGFLDGAQWQQERMYSEEEVFEIVRLMDITGGVGDHCGPVTREKWFEQFKKK